MAPDSTEIDVSLANALFAQGKLSPEKQSFYAVVTYDLGQQYRQQGNWETAAQYYRKAIALKPDWAEAYHSLGLALQKASSSNLDEAIACYQKAQALEPASLKADVSLANACFARGKLPAEKLADYAARNHDLGYQYQQLGDLELAIDHYRQAIAMEPNLIEARDNLRLALQKQGNVQIKVSVAK
ncbi:tetratricopeptide repeat protein [Leptolyngbya sp. 7M]|uniref:tetratricopeptide repeat protein n=1 Tax=Leptolyngbya sp. 7M TaxID=2812896 RepID=UPI001B8B66ED|nr:tetratricopeptide repeat protein [Leptolyngbya sp. 7M]QYO65086.1 tetratricopeptide repeat protein [Leptolyngbya sp. 7M]